MSSTKSFKIRPRFKVETSMRFEDLQERIQNALKSEDAPCKGHIIPGHATFYLPQEHQHYWSPQLSLTFEKNDEGGKGCILRGLYGPRPHVWTLFLLFYTIIGTAFFFIGIYGLSHLSLDKPATILWLEPLLIAIFLTLYLVAYYGQKLGSKQIVLLHIFIEDALGIKID